MNKAIDSERLRQIRCWLLDMDGTITLGEEALPGSEVFFAAIAGSKYIFLTNNSSHGIEYYIRRLSRIGIPVSRANILSSTDALAKILKEAGPSDRPVSVFPVGTQDFENDLAADGISLVKVREASIDFVVLGFDTSLTYEKLDIACDYIRRGVPYLAANPDRVCPLDNGRVLPDCGALIAFMETCTGQKPLRVVGKPDPAMAEMVLGQGEFTRDQLAMVGDRLYTDIEFARRADIVSVAVLSGETTLDEIAASDIRPDYIFRDVGELAQYLTMP